VDVGGGARGRKGWQQRGGSEAAAAAAAAARARAPAAGWGAAVDVGAGAHKSVINFVVASDESLIVLTPEPTAIMDAYSLIKVIADNKSDQKLGILINKTNSVKEAQNIADRIRNVVKKYLTIDIDLKGIIPFDQNIKNSVQEQKPLLESKPRSKCCKAINKLAKKLLNKKSEETSRGVKSFMYRVIGLFGNGSKD